MNRIEETTLKQCSICDGFIEPVGTWLLGNNAQPINNGRCCDKCNAEKVIPARIEMVRRAGANGGKGGHWGQCANPNN